MGLRREAGALWDLGKEGSAGGHTGRGLKCAVGTLGCVLTGACYCAQMDRSRGPGRRL